MLYVPLPKALLTARAGYNLYAIDRMGRKETKMANAKKTGRVLAVLAVVAALLLTGCGSKTEGEKGGEASKAETSAAEKNEAKFQGKVIEATDKEIVVEPAEGSSERKSSDRIAIPADKVGTPVNVGDVLEITYDGTIKESYPAQLGTILSVEVVQQVK